MQRWTNWKCLCADRRSISEFLAPDISNASALDTVAKPLR